MYVCVCKAVSDKQIKDAAGQGIRTLKELCLHYGVGTQCGKCCRHAHDVLNEVIAETPALSSMTQAA